MADFEGSASLTQGIASCSSSGDAVNPGGTQRVGVCLAVGAVIHEGSAAAVQLVAAVSASGSAYDVAGTSAVVQAAATASASGNSGPAIQAAITQSGQWVSAAGTVVSSGSVSPSTLSAQQAVISRRDIQLPRIPTSVPKDAQDWFLAAQKIIDKYIFGGDGSRLVSINDLTKAGIADRDGSGVRPPAGNLTTPPKVTGLRADGALASIIIAWQNPVFPNYSHTELWRASVDDLGQAVKIQETPVESYVDMVGSGSTKYYWARAVSKAGVAGDFNAAAGTKGVTGYDPAYVRDLMTSATWKPVTPYGAYQYVRPTTPNGYQYACIDGGRSGGDEPTWPTTVGDTVNDADIVWQCVAADSRVPFVIGADPNGDPAVYIDTAYIEDATITSAKIGDLVADKITTGNLLANIQLLSKIWYGFEEYANPGFAPGLWIGIGGDNKPKLHMSCGGDPDLATTRFLNFDGNELKLQVDIASGADIHADDLTADSASLTRAQIDTLIAPEVVVASDYAAEAGIGVDNPEIALYYCFPGGCWKTETSTSTRLLVGDGIYRHYGYHQTGTYTSIVPYDLPDAGTLYRARQKRIGLTIRVSANGIGRYPVRNYLHHLDLYIFDEYQSLGNGLSYSDPARTTGVPSTYLGKITIPFESGGYAAEASLPVMQNTGSGDVHVCDARVIPTRTISSSVDANGVATAIVTSDYITFYIDDDEEAFGYSMGRRLKCAVVYKVNPWVGTNDDSDQFSYIVIDMQIVSDISQTVANNDARL